MNNMKGGKVQTSPNTRKNTSPDIRGRLPTTLQTDRIIRVNEVCDLAGISKSSIYAVPDFPRRIKLSTHAVGWRLSEVQHWINTRCEVGVQP